MGRPCPGQTRTAATTIPSCHWKILTATDGWSRRSTTVAAASPPAHDTAFSEFAQQYRRELHVHCYRLLASFEEAEDAVQETFLKAWRSRERVEDRGQFRAWLYRVAT